MSKIPDIQIEADHWKIVRATLLETLGNCDVYAFGSRARKSAKPYSDLDLAVRSQHPISQHTLARASLEFEESDLPWSVDIIDIDDVTPEFRKAIESDLVLLLTASE